jgi:hypothetical protein
MLAAYAFAHLCVYPYGHMVTGASVRKFANRARFKGSVVGERENRSMPMRTAQSLAAEAAFRTRLTELDATLLEPKWLGVSRPHRVRCAAGHECTPRPHGVIRGQGVCVACGRANTARGNRSTSAEAAFRARLAELGATLLEPEWLGAMRPHRARCAAGHDCTPRPHEVRHTGKICPRCSWTAAGRARSQATEAAFRACLTELGAELLEPYHGSAEPHQVRCAAGHIGKPHPSDVLGGAGICRACAGVGHPAVAEAAFRARLTELGAELLEPEWLGTKVPHRVRCAAGHEVRPRPGNVLQGHDVCRACLSCDPTMAEAAFRARLAELSATLLEPEWLGAMRPHRVRCAAGHDCTPRPNDVQQGHGICHACRGQSWDVFYVVEHVDGDRLKFGITSGTGRARLATHANGGYTRVILLRTSLPEGTAHAMERAVRSTLAFAGERPVQGREYFDSRALAVVLDIAANYPITEAGPRPGGSLSNCP